MILIKIFNTYSNKEIFINLDLVQEVDYGPPYHGWYEEGIPKDGFNLNMQGNTFFTNKPEDISFIKRIIEVHKIIL